MLNKYRLSLLSQMLSLSALLLIIWWHLPSRVINFLFAPFSFTFVCHRVSLTPAYFLLGRLLHHMSFLLYSISGNTSSLFCFLFTLHRCPSSTSLSHPFCPPVALHLYPLRVASLFLPSSQHTVVDHVVSRPRQALPPSPGERRQLFKNRAYIMATIIMNYPLMDHTETDKGPHNFSVRVL